MDKSTRGISFIDLRQQLIAEFASGSDGLMLAGSFSRGDMDEFSDVDIWRFVTPEESDNDTPLRLRQMGAYLVSITTTSVAEKLKQMTRPESAIWAVPGIRQAQVLFDPSEELACLKQQAEEFVWEPLQPRADLFASQTLAGLLEETLKILRGLRDGDEAVASYATLGMALECARVLSIRRGWLIPTENRYLAVLQENAGSTSIWSCTFRLALGLDVPPDDNLPWKRRAQAALSLFQETARLVDAAIHGEERVLVDLALRKINCDHSNQDRQACYN
jgi:hypothetical protein